MTLVLILAALIVGWWIFKKVLGFVFSFLFLAVITLAVLYFFGVLSFGT